MVGSNCFSLTNSLFYLKIYNRNTPAHADERCILFIKASINAVPGLAFFRPQIFVLQVFVSDFFVSHIFDFVCTFFRSCIFRLIFCLCILSSMHFSL